MNARPEPEVMDREAPPTDSATLVAINRAEIDGQIATARAFPRSIATFMREARELVSIDEETAEACIYSLPRGKDRDGNKKFITGPSARFAEIVMYCFGNNRGGGRVVAIEKDTVTAQGVFHDLEKNVQITKEVQRSIIDSYGKRYKPDMINVTGNAGISIALRNAVLAGIPQALWLPIYEAARQAAVGDVTTLSTRRHNAILWFGKVGISPEQIFAQLGVEGIEDIGIEQLETLVGIKTAIRRGDTTPEAAFTPEHESTLRAGTSAAGVVDMAKKVAEKRDAKKPPADMNPATGEVPMPTKTLTPTELKAAIFQADTLADLEALREQVQAIEDEAVQADVQDAYDAAVERMS